MLYFPRPTVRQEVFEYVLACAASLLHTASIRFLETKS